MPYKVANWASGKNFQNKALTGLTVVVDNSGCNSRRDEHAVIPGVLKDCYFHIFVCLKLLLLHLKKKICSILTPTLTQSSLSFKPPTIDEIKKIK